MIHTTTPLDLLPHALTAYQDGVTIPKYNPTTTRTYYQDTHHFGLAGFIGVLPVKGNVWRITTWYVLRQHRSAGHGRHLHQAAHAHAIQHGAEVLELRTNQPALADNFGYQPTGRLYGQYHEYARKA